VPQSQHRSRPMEGGVRGGHEPDRGPVQRATNPACGRAVGAAAVDCAAKTAGRSRSGPGSRPHRHAAICCAGPPGTPTPSATTCAEYVVEHLTTTTRWLVVERDRRCEEGRPHGRGPAPVHRNAGGSRLQVAVYLVYAGARGHARWTGAYIPAPDKRPGPLPGSGGSAKTVSRPSRTCPTMIERFLDAGPHVGWVTGDEVYAATQTAHGSGGTRPRLCPGGACSAQWPPVRHVPRRRPGEEGAEAGLAKTLG